MKSVLTVIGSLLIVVLALMRVFVPPALDASMNVVKPHEPWAVSPKAQALHDELFIVDLHSDSLLWDRDLLQEADYGQMDLPRLQRGNVGLQVFSATTKSPTSQNYESNEAGTDTITALAMVQGWPYAAWGSLLARAEFQLDKLLDLVQDSEGAMLFIRSKADLQQLLAQRDAGKGTVGAMYLIEGAHPLEGDIDNLDRLHEQGLHFVGLTHFFDNLLGGSLHGISGAGLTAFGREVIQRADALGMNIDIAHAAPQMVRDVLALARRPVILSHGGFKGHCDTPRNLDDELMKAVADQGGIVGVGYWDATVCDDSPLGVVRAIRYGIDLMGLEHIALGSDYDGTVATTFDTAELAALTQAMLDEDFSEDEIRAVMGGNMRRYLLEQLP
ncbi:MAG: dipeptidase [Halioglobus sp.]|nr:dipeptidase [Halioglobus sp.]